MEVLRISKNGNDNVRNIMLKIEYDGTNYCGWQTQPNGKTIQEEITKALFKLTGDKITIYGSGRTDSKVHARGQVANFYLDSSIPTERIPMAVNRLLPDDISITEAYAMPQDFHARFSAIGKRYQYQIYTGRYRSPLLRNYAYHVHLPLNFHKMTEASRILIGTHDFKGFMASGSSVENTIRTIHSIDLEKKDNNIWISFEGNGFLYNMVRIMVGTLVDIGLARKTEFDLQNILDKRDRKLARHTAPAQGLYLDKVFYPLTH